MLQLSNFYCMFSRKKKNGVILFLIFPFASTNKMPFKAKNGYIQDGKIDIFILL